ncbi:MAG: hypothetical protein KatS3mg061_1384 [Dehalococcoidia bacterium]|nr:MAG: hypothetical protein KatS3mg061_1384 [Dehalococcoidia bacterium]
MRDASELARHGIPAVILLPRGLASLAREQAEFLGLPDLPLAILDRPLYGRSAAALTADAAAQGELLRAALSAETAGRAPSP